jgi:hypothetical protein
MVLSFTSIGLDFHCLMFSQPLKAYLLRSGYIIHGVEYQYMTEHSRRDSTSIVDSWRLIPWLAFRMEAVNMKGLWVRIVRPTSSKVDKEIDWAKQNPPVVKVA